MYCAPTAKSKPTFPIRWEIVRNRWIRRSYSEYMTQQPLELLQKALSLSEEERAPTRLVP
jgi:hypothetical protein